MSILQSLRRCQNLTCPYERNVWRALSADGYGVWFQSHWHCSQECFAQALADSVRHLLPMLRKSERGSHRIPLGVALISNGLVSEDQVRTAVAEQQTHGGPLGVHIQRTAGLDEGSITSALASQWGCPIYNLSEKPRFLRLTGLVPASLARRYGLVPVRFLARKRVLEVAFRESLSPEPLQAMEHLLRCRTRPGVADASAVSAALELFLGVERPFDRDFHEATDLGRIVAEIEGMQRQIHADKVAIAHSGPHLWVRLSSRKQSANLVFGE